MARSERKKIIAEIEGKRGSKVLCYVTGDRNPASAQIGDDAVRPIYEHLRHLKHVPKLDFFIYSRGGAIDVPWRIISAFRRASDEWNILVPFRANSAATLIALGADSIVMGPQGELGPIDPIMSFKQMVQGPDGQGTILQEQVSVEDVMAYVRFVQERGGLSDQHALAMGLTKLIERIDAVGLGSVYRTHSHIRDVARRALLSRKSPASEQALGTIIETLAEKVYAHGHAIGPKAANEIGLPVEEAPADLDELLWALLNDYESEMKLLEPLDPGAAVASADQYTETAVIGIIESEAFIHRFSGRIEVRVKRQMPPTLNVSVNVNLQMPPLPTGPGGQPTAPVQAYLQQAVGQGQQAILQAAQHAVQEAIKAQAPIVGIEAAFRGGSWNRSD